MSKKILRNTQERVWYALRRAVKCDKPEAEFV